MKKYTLFEKVCIGIGLCIAGLIFFDILISNPDDTSRSITKTEHFDKIEKQIVKGNVSYKLYVKENKAFYTIGATGSDCFDYERFKTKVNEGDLLTISTNIIGSSFFKTPVVIYLGTKDGYYLESNCINRETKAEKSSAIESFIVAFFLLTIYVIYRKVKNNN